MSVSYSIAQIARKINAVVVGDDNTTITGVAQINLAQAGQLTFLVGGRYASLLPETKASAVIVSKEHHSACPTTALVVDNPELAFAQVAKLFDAFTKPVPGIHPTAVIAASAQVAASASIGAYCVIGENAIIGEDVTLLSHVVVSDRVIIGDACLLYANVTIYHDVVIGHHVTLHSGVVIGADGFGLARSAAGWEKVPQLGRVVIHDHVEIGANTCIDRGALADTEIHTGVKIDNLVQIAHNVVIGAHTAIAGCVGIAGSTRIGKQCMIGGAANIGGHLTITDNVVVTGNAMVTGSINEPGVYSSGTGLFTNANWRKMAVRLRQLDQFFRKNK